MAFDVEPRRVQANGEAVRQERDAVASGRALEIVGPGAHQRNWAMMTFLYALMQALGGYAMAALYGALHSFDLLFAIGASVLLLAAAIASVGGRAPLTAGVRR